MLSFFRDIWIEAAHHIFVNKNDKNRYHLHNLLFGALKVREHVLVLKFAKELPERLNHFPKDSDIWEVSCLHPPFQCWGGGLDLYYPFPIV